MTHDEALQFIADNAAGLAAIGITVTTANSGAGTDLHVEHKSSGAMPVLLGDLADVQTFMLGLQMGMAVAHAAQGQQLDEIDAAIERVETAVAEKRHELDEMADRPQGQTGVVELEEDR